MAPGSICKAGAEAHVDLGPGVAQAGRLQPVTPNPQQPDALGHAAQQSHRVPLDDRTPTPTRPCRPSGRGRCGQAGRPRGDAGLGGGQATVGQQGEPVAVGDERDERIEAGEQPAVLGWHGGSLRGRGKWAAAACHAAPPARRGVRRSVDELPG
jgi:hypothetical protein